MKNNIIKPHLQVISLGLLAGMRSMAAPAITSHMLSRRHHKELEDTPLNFIQSKTTANILSILALGEFIGDKLPAAPKRTAAPGLIGRCLSGAMAGASIYKASGRNVYAGALLGSATAMGATYASFYLRKYLVKQTHLTDPVIGGIEDVIVLGAGLILVETR